MHVLSQELVERTGRNPQYVYQQLGCSKNAVTRMLHYARTRCVGKPFSNMGMARSLLWPRHTDSSSFFCAELVAAILKEGGLMDQTSNPGSATPESLYRIYKDRAAVTANPFVLRDMQSAAGLSFASTVGHAPHASAEHVAERESLLQSRAIMAPMPPMRPAYQQPATSGLGERRRVDSPPRGHFRVVTHGGASRPQCASASHAQCRHLPTAAGNAGAVASAAGNRTGLQLTLHSLDMSKR